MAIKRETRQEAMKDPFGGDPALEALAKDYFEKRKHERMRKGLARAGQFPMAVAGIPAAQREALAPIKPVRVSYEDAATFNRGIHDRLKDLEQYLSSPGASAGEANKKLAELYKTVLGEASANARTNATNVTRVALSRAGLEEGLSEAYEARLEGEAVGFKGPSPDQITGAMAKLDKALHENAINSEQEVVQVLTAFGAKFPTHLDEMVKYVQENSPRELSTGDPAVDIGLIVEETQNRIAQVKGIEDVSEGQEAWKIVSGIDSFLEEAKEHDEAKFSEWVKRYAGREGVVRQLRAGGTAVGSEADKLVKVLEMLDAKYGNLQRPEDILEVEKSVRPKTRAMYDKVAESLVTPSAPTAFEESERALIGSPGFKEFMEEYGLTKNQAVRLLTRQARRGAFVADDGAGAPPEVVDAEASEAGAETPPTPPKTSPGAALAAPAGGERPKKPPVQEGLDRGKAIEEQTSWFGEGEGEGEGKFGLPPQSEVGDLSPDKLADERAQQVMGDRAFREAAARVREMNARRAKEPHTGRATGENRFSGWAHETLSPDQDPAWFGSVSPSYQDFMGRGVVPPSNTRDRVALKTVMDEILGQRKANKAAEERAVRSKEILRREALVAKEPKTYPLVDLEDLINPQR